MSETLGELRGLSDDELVRRHDKHAQSTGVGTAHYLNELARRDIDRLTRAMVRLTRWILAMTVVVAVLSVVTAVAAVAD